MRVLPSPAPLPSPLTPSPSRCADDVYDGKCIGRYEGGESAGCFSSRSENIRYDPAAWAAYYERVYEMRRREVSRSPVSSS